MRVCRGWFAAIVRQHPRPSQTAAPWPPPVCSDDLVQNPLAKRRALLALRAQAASWLAAHDADLVARARVHRRTAHLPSGGAEGAGHGGDRCHPGAWELAIEGWTDRIKRDVVVATMYGQLFSWVERLPLRR